MQDYPIDSEGLSQTDETVFDIAQPAVNLAVAVLNHHDTLATSSARVAIINQALEIIYKYGDWANIPISSHYKLDLMRRDFSGEEAQAILLKDWPVNQWFTVEDIAGKDDRGLYKYLCDMETGRHVRSDGAMLISAMTGERFKWELKV